MQVKLGSVVLSLPVHRSAYLK